MAAAGCERGGQQSVRLGRMRAGHPNGVPATVHDLDGMGAAFVGSAELAMEAGADGVDAHARHRYLPDQLLWEGQSPQ
jgi:2,4-dienoyl-CoA reductase-like NADH-dependent reductase (Old Yellow Enzyme family)